MDTFKIRLFADNEATGKPGWEREFRSPSINNAVFQARERSLIPAFDTGLRFAVLSNHNEETVWSAYLKGDDAE